MIVDDDRDCLESIRAVLEREGYEVKSAERVDAAVEALSTGKFDIVFCDYRMPDKTRIDCCGKFEARVATSRGDDLGPLRPRRRARCPRNSEP